MASNNLVTRRNFARTAGLTAAIAGACAPAAAHAGLSGLGSLKSILAGGTTEPEPEPEPTTTPEGPTAQEFKTSYVAFLKENGYFYEELDEFAVKLPYGLDNIDTCNVFVIFDENDANHVRIVTWTLLTATTDAELLGLLYGCNTANSGYLWAKFYVDDENDLDCAIDAIITPENANAEVDELVNRFVNIIDDNFPMFQENLAAMA